MKKKKKKGKENKTGKTVIPKRTAGQPTIFTAKLGANICERLSQGQSLRSICRLGSMPGMSTVMNWLFDSEKNAGLKKFAADYEHARDMYTDHVFEETLEIADGALLVTSAKGMRGIAGPRVNALRLQIDTRKWFLSRMRPVKYGEKLDVTSKGKELKQARAAIINYVVPTKPKQTAA